MVKKPRWTRWFKVNGSNREFMFYASARTKVGLQPHIRRIKGQGDLYRVTKYKGGYEVWDARR